MKKKILCQKGSIRNGKILFKKNNFDKMDRFGLISMHFPIPSRYLFQYHVSSMGWDDAMAKLCGRGSDREIYIIVEKKFSKLGNGWRFWAEKLNCQAINPFC